MKNIENSKIFFLNNNVFKIRFKYFDIPYVKYIVSNDNCAFVFYKTTDDTVAPNAFTYTILTRQNSNTLIANYNQVQRIDKLLNIPSIKDSIYQKCIKN